MIWKVMYTNKIICPLKGKLVRITIQGRNRKEQTGIVNAIGKQHVLFGVNGTDLEISVPYSEIVDITELKK
jgi:hypothetical protein